VVSLTVSAQGVEMSAARIAFDRLLGARWRSRIALADIDGFADVSPGGRELHFRFVSRRTSNSQGLLAQEAMGRA